MFINPPKNILSYSVSQYDKNSIYLMSFNVSEVPEWVLQCRNNWEKVKSQLFEKLTTELIKLERKYMYGNLKL